LDSAQIEELYTRIDNLEKRDKEEIVTIVEILANVNFFGGLKKANCEYAKKGQCSLFYLQINARDKIPLATECRVPDCGEDHNHRHLEISSITCTFCPRWNNTQFVNELPIQNLSGRNIKR